MTKQGQTVVARMPSVREDIRYPIGQPLPGTKYVVVRKLGQGGMGAVFEVVKSPGIRGVIKIIHPGLAADPEVRRQFFAEVAILAKLDHPNIVKVTDYDELADGTPYFAMELLTGGTVRQVLRAKGALDAAHLYKIMRGTLAGLDYLHTHTPSIVHRDIKGDNVFIHVPAFGDPCVKVIDFGLAWPASAEVGGGFAGSRRSAAPEQIRGEPVTFKADLYSAGLMLYEGLAGRGPFDDVPLIEADGRERMQAIVRAHLTIHPPPVRIFAPWVPESIDALLQSALAKDPEKRPASAHAFAARLFVLQFSTDAPVGKNSTVLNLNTLAELVSVSGATAEPTEAVPSRTTQEAWPSSAPTTRRLGPTNAAPVRAPHDRGRRGLPDDMLGTVATLHDTAVDPILPVYEHELKEDEGAPEEELTTRRVAASASDPVARIHAAVAVPREPPIATPQPRSFAELEEAAVQARNVVVHGSTPSREPMGMEPGGNASGGSATPPRSQEHMPADAYSTAHADASEGWLHRLLQIGQARPSEVDRFLAIAVITSVLILLAAALVVLLLARLTSSPVPVAPASARSVSLHGGSTEMEAASWLRCATPNPCLEP